MLIKGKDYPLFAGASHLILIILCDAFAIRNDYALGIDLEKEPNFYWISETHRVKSALLDEKSQKYYPPKLIQELWKEYLDEHGSTNK
nr:hypothetical protein [Mycoplasmopsis cynos]